MRRLENHLGENFSHTLKLGFVERSCPPRDFLPCSLVKHLEGAGAQQITRSLTEGDLPDGHPDAKHRAREAAAAALEGLQQVGPSTGGRPCFWHCSQS